MKRKMALLGVSMFLAACGASAKDEGAALKQVLSERMPGIQVQQVKKTPYAGLYEVIVNDVEVFYTDASGDIAFFGNVVDLKSQKNLTAQRQDELRWVDFAKLPFDRAIVKVKGNGARKMAIFSDLDCPFCRQLEQELQGVNNVTIYTFLFPLTQLHPDAARKSKLIWCSKDRAKAYDDLMLKGVQPAGDGKCDTPLESNAALAEKLHISGTPGIVFSSGRLVAGAVPKEQIEKLLDEGALQRKM